MLALFTLAAVHLCGVIATTNGLRRLVIYAAKHGHDAVPQMAELKNDATVADLKTLTNPHLLTAQLQVSYAGRILADHQLLADGGVCSESTFSLIPMISGDFQGLVDELQKHLNALNTTVPYSNAFDTANALVQKAWDRLHSAEGQSVCMRFKVPFKTLRVHPTMGLLQDRGYKLHTITKDSDERYSFVPKNEVRSISRSFQFVGSIVNLGRFNDGFD